MFLDALDSFKAIDQANMLGHIDNLPDQIEAAWVQGQAASLAPGLGEVAQVVICGMGGSAISGDLLAALVGDSCRLPITVNREYDLPAWASGPETLAIALSYSGTTEETLSAARQAIERGMRLLAITTGGELARLAEEKGGTVLHVDYDSQPRAALGWLYGLLLATCSRLGLIEDQGKAAAETIVLLSRDREALGAHSPTKRNLAKRMAGQIVDCVPVVWGSGLLAPVARRWKTQLNENAKSCAYFDTLPELNHNTVAGILAPEELLNRHKFQIIQLRSPRYDHPRVRLRQEVTAVMLREQGIIADAATARGESRLAQQMSLIQFGDYVSYYLAMAYQVDPTPIPPIALLKKKLAEAG